MQRIETGKPNRTKIMTGYDGLVVAIIFKAVKDKDSKSPPLARDATDWLRNGGLSSALNMLDCSHLRENVLHHLELDHPPPGQARPTN